VAMATTPNPLLGLTASPTASRDIPRECVEG
jgi:hypothetical protein